MNLNNTIWYCEELNDIIIITAMYTINNTKYCLYYDTRLLEKRLRLNSSKNFKCEFESLTNHYECIGKL